MKKLLLVNCLFLFNTALLAQNPHGPAGGSGVVAGNGSVFGKLTDSSGKIISDAAVMVLKMSFDAASQSHKGSLLKSVSTKSNGEFSLEDIPFSQPFQLKISAYGFKPYSQFIALEKGDIPKDLGKIKLVADFRQLEDVTVVSSQKLLKMDIDKLSFNVEKNMITSGGTALDVMKYIPSIQTDIDGNVKLRNATPQIFIDGRPTTLSLDQIPADAIETVEVITNPSARYDASGGNAGILNLILKKNRKMGYNANIRAGIDRRGAVNGGVDLSLRQGKINFSAAFNAMQFKNFTTGSTDQFNAFILPHQQVAQEIDNRAYGGVVFGKLGLDYFASNRTSFSMNVLKAKWQFRPFDVISSDIMAGGERKYADRNARLERTFSPTGLQFGLKHIFPKEGREITADATWFSGGNSITSNAYTDSMTAGRAVFASEQQLVTGTGNYSFLTIQTDYVDPITRNLKLETGLRASLKKLDNFTETSVNNNNNGFIKLPNAGTNYKNTDNVYAAYVVISGTTRNIGYQTGLRAESSTYTGTVLTTNDTFKNHYAISLFPSLFLSKKLNNNQQLQLSYSRRVNRPSFFNLIPFIDRTDPLNYSRGNPAVKPEFTHSFNANYNRTFKNNNTVLLSAYYKRTANMITRFQQKEYDPVSGKDILVNTYMNARAGSNYGAEMTSVFVIKKWWDLTTNINAYNAEINTSNITDETIKPIWSWFGKLNNTFKLPKSYTIQLSANYQSKSNLPVNSGTGGHFAQALTASQGYIKANYGIDLSFRKTFLKNNAAAVTLGFSDIFRSRWQHQHSENAYFIQDYSRLRDPQMVRLNFSYRFGKADLSIFKRKNMKAEGEGMQGAAQGVGQ